MEYRDLKDLCEEIYQLNFEPYLTGRRDLFMGLMSAYLSRGHVLLEGPPGTAKTLIAKLIAKTFSKSFKRIQFTDDLMPKQVIGSHFWHQGKGEYRFIAGPLFSEIILADEINRAPPRTQSAFLEAMEERQLSIEGNTLDLGENFFVIATQNPGDFAGTHPLPEVQLDRFIFSFRLQYAGIDEEVSIIQKHLSGMLPPNLSNLRTLDIDIAEFQSLLHAVHVEEDLIRYAATIVRATRDNNYFRRGASSRALIAIVKGAQVHAALEGRDAVMAEDIRALVLPALRHRIALSDEGKQRKRNVEEAITDMLNNLDGDTKAD